MINTKKALHCKCLNSINCKKKYVKKICDLDLLQYNLYIFFIFILFFFFFGCFNFLLLILIIILLLAEFLIYNNFHINNRRTKIKSIEWQACSYLIIKHLEILIKKRNLWGKSIFWKSLKKNNILWYWARN